MAVFFQSIDLLSFLVGFFLGATCFSTVLRFLPDSVLRVFKKIGEEAEQELKDESS